MSRKLIRRTLMWVAPADSPNLSGSSDRGRSSLGKKVTLQSVNPQEDKNSLTIAGSPRKTEEHNRARTRSVFQRRPRQTAVHANAEDAIKSAEEELEQLREKKIEKEEEAKNKKKKKQKKNEDKKRRKRRHIIDARKQKRKSQGKKKRPSGQDKLKLNEFQNLVGQEPTTLLGQLTKIKLTYDERMREAIELKPSNATKEHPHITIQRKIEAQRRKNVPYHIQCK